MTEVESKQPTTPIHTPELMRNVCFSVKYELRLRCRCGTKWLFVWENRLLTAKNKQQQQQQKIMCDLMIGSKCEPYFCLLLLLLLHHFVPFLCCHLSVVYLCNALFLFREKCKNQNVCVCIKSIPKYAMKQRQEMCEELRTKSV